MIDNKDNRQDEKNMEEKRKKVLIVNIFTTAVFGLLMILSAGPAMMSPMMFDAPGSLENDGLVMIFFSVFSFPFVCLASITAAWIFFGFKKYRACRISSLLPLVNFAALACGILLMYMDGGF